MMTGYRICNQLRNDPVVALNKSFDNRRTGSGMVDMFVAASKVAPGTLVCIFRGRAGDLPVSRRFRDSNWLAEPFGTDREVAVRNCSG